MTGVVIHPLSTDSLVCLVALTLSKLLTWVQFESGSPSSREHQGLRVNPRRPAPGSGGATSGGWWRMWNQGLERLCPGSPSPD